MKDKLHQGLVSNSLSFRLLFIIHKFTGRLLINMLLDKKMKLYEKVGKIDHLKYKIHK